MQLLSTMRTFEKFTEYVDYYVVDNSDGKWAMLVWINKEIPQPTQEELEKAWVEIQKEQEIMALKEEKRLAIEKIATLSDELNTMMEAIYETVIFTSKDKPEILELPAIKAGLELREKIKNILNN